MKNILFLFIAMSILSCKNESKNQSVKSVETSVEKQIENKKSYPENISKIFEAHGGIDAWNEMNTIAFTMQKPTGDEITTTDLKTRKALVEMPMHTIGFDGKSVWLHSKGDEVYKGKPKFTYNLMFYFYTMPFVLSDAGITYEDVEPLVFEGQEFPGIKISYDNGVGESSDDEYIIYYNSETHQMEWLAYTMTYFAKEKSKKFSYIKYNEWHTINGILLPKAIQWYNVVDGKVTDMKNEVVFTNVSVSKEKKDPSFFEIPEGAEIVE